jgi:ribosome-associated protein
MVKNSVDRSFTNMKASDFVMQKEVKISTDTITLGQFLKLADIIQTGGMAKWFLQEHDVFINGELEKRRGRKLKPQDVIDIPNIGTFIVTS